MTKYIFVTGGVVSGGSSLPIIHDSEAAARLNEYAKEKGIETVMFMNGGEA